METFKAPFKGRSLLNWIDWTPEEIEKLLNLAIQVKAEAHRGEVHQRFLGKTIALIFEKRSTRTRSSFETAFGEEGGHPVFMSTDDIQLGGKESVKDTARVLGRMFSAIEFRGFKQSHVEELAKYSGIPVINGLTDEFHPTQALADIMTLKENFETLKGLTWAFCGDGRNNVARSMMLISAKMGINFSIYSPKELFPDQQIIDICKPFAEKSGAKIQISDKIDVVKGADALYTDVWVSMGEEALKDQRIKLLTPFQVNSDLMKATGKPNTIFLHCLPAVKGQEVTEEVFESTASRVWDEAENRKHTIKAIMLGLI
ncbi:MAG: ornithine carbamoyltransferase [Spirochaetia bacterium]|nr:ornithine carbamoyltransferase [Treponema sp.]MCI6316892.1 ornithine carbamoyltransferase [Spirochaetia bacterium]MCI6365779.1 ornithine carbamoyltransferase [Spirochaetia bacterium]MCI6545587.1 ornithine carbamoyltransferase [Spirochaetia bacterium]MCI7436835.1 ornithine carbamoyltransferase [Spirochaetia bacterium]